MKCPKCRATSTDVFNTRVTKFGSQIWRRRRCLSCQQAFTTYEAIDISFLKVTAPGQSKPLPYSRAKLYLSLYQAFADVPQRDTDVDAVTATIETKLLDLQLNPLAIADIAQVVLVTLHHFNVTAFLRYLSFHTELNSNAQLKKIISKF